MIIIDYDFLKDYRERLSVDMMLIDIFKEYQSITDIL